MDLVFSCSNTFHLMTVILQLRIDLHDIMVQHGGKDGVRSAEYGVQSAECGVRSAEYGVRSTECGVQTKPVKCFPRLGGHF